ncbi:hypothetical protein [Amycolatopsis sp. cmx-4-54]|uniref:hypothetical protein n=1 Tax=Amycolatopsis sp. cmx-4-54 TaxID=2790936 RepID=UPI00397D03D7
MTILDTARTRIQRIAAPFVTRRHEDLPPGDGTVVSLASYLRRRGWITLDGACPTRADFCYPGGFQGALAIDDRRLPIADLNLQDLECTLSRHGDHWTATFTSCGAVIGCDRHRSNHATIGAHGTVFAAVLDDMERHARHLKPRDIAHCLHFGACGRDDASGHPAARPQEAPDEPATPHTVVPRYRTGHGLDLTYVNFDHGGADGDQSTVYAMDNLVELLGADGRTPDAGIIGEGNFWRLFGGKGIGQAQHAL